MALVITNPVIVRPINREQWRDMQQWCETNISAGGKTWMPEVKFGEANVRYGAYEKRYTIYFIHATEATMFALKWL